MAAVNVKARAFTRKAIEFFQDIFFSILSALVVFRLGNMQLDGLATFAGVTIGLLFGFTSLQFNRARAYRSGPVQRRTLFAAELSFRATLAFTFGAIVTAIIFKFLAEGGYVATPPNKLPTQGAPAVLAFVPLAFFAYTVYTLSRVTRLLIHGMFSSLSVRRLARSS
jgi:hypothetical protein